MQTFSEISPSFTRCSPRLFQEGLKLAQQERGAPVDFAGEAAPFCSGERPWAAGIANAGDTRAQGWPFQPARRCAGCGRAAAALTLRPPAWHGPAQDRPPSQPAAAHRGATSDLISFLLAKPGQSALWQHPHFFQTKIMDFAGVAGSNCIVAPFVHMSCAPLMTFLLWVTWWDGITLRQACQYQSRTLCKGLGKAYSGSG